MIQLLNKIIQALRDENYRFSDKHYWRQFILDPPRPLPSSIIDSIGSDVPEIIEDYPNDPRGSSCLILGLNGNDNQIHTVVSYKYSPIRIVTAYYPDNRFEDGRIRR